MYKKKKKKKDLRFFNPNYSSSDLRHFEIEFPRLEDFSSFFVYHLMSAGDLFVPLCLKGVFDGGSRKDLYFISPTRTRGG